MNYRIKLASLALFFAIFASGVAVGMEIPSGLGGMAEEQENWLHTEGREVLEGSMPSLPSDVKKLILTQLLRLVLDEAEDNPSMLMSREKLNFFMGILAKYVTGGALESYTSTNNIDFIIKLIAAGADPNVKSYKGNTVLHLLMPLEGMKDTEREFLLMKIKILLKYGLNLNAKNGAGNTVAHEFIQQYVKEYQYIREWKNLKLMSFLAHLGLNFTTIKNNIGQTPIELGQALIESRINESDNSLDIIPLMNAWMAFLSGMDKRTKNYYGKLLWESAQRKISELGNIDQALQEILRMNYNQFMTAE